MPNPSLNPLTWLGRVLAAWAVAKYLEATGSVWGSPEAADAIHLADTLVEEGTGEAEAVARLQATPGGRKALRNAAEMLARYANDGYPFGPMYRLLRAASGEPIAPPSREELAAEARARKLEHKPTDAAFAELAEQVPELRRLEESVRSDPANLLREATAADVAMFGGLPTPDSRGVPLLIGKMLHEAVSRLVGPHSGQQDRFLASSAAWNVAFDYLYELIGSDP